ncbi:unnamed protein product [Effrenium voratum]|nr:unnamed protein product [Effrenium voratum]
MGCCKSRRRWLAPSIDYDPDFRETQKVFGSPLHCPGGHAMEVLMTHRPGHLRCDICGNKQGLGCRMQGCWECDYHVCETCEPKFQNADFYNDWYSFWNGGKQLVDNDGAGSTASTALPLKMPLCPGRHSMVAYFGAKDPPVLCDVCGTRQRPYRRLWGCRECNYDVGLCCADKFSDVAWLQSWWSFHREGEVDEEFETEDPRPSQPPVVLGKPLEKYSSTPGPAPSAPAPSPSAKSDASPSPVEAPFAPEEAEQCKITRQKPEPLKIPVQEGHAASATGKLLPLGGAPPVAPGIMMQAESYLKPASPGGPAARLQEPGEGAGEEGQAVGGVSGASRRRREEEVAQQEDRRGQKLQRARAQYPQAAGRSEATLRREEPPAAIAEPTNAPDEDRREKKEKKERSEKSERKEKKDRSEKKEKKEKEEKEGDASETKERKSKKEKKEKEGDAVNRSKGRDEEPEKKHRHRSKQQEEGSA